MFVGIKFRKRTFKKIGLIIISSNIRLDDIFQYILLSSGRVRGGGMDPLGRKLEKIIKIFLSEYSCLRFNCEGKCRIIYILIYTLKNTVY